MTLSVLEPLPRAKRKPNAVPPTRKGVNLNLKFVGANKKIKIAPFRRIDTRMSFYLGDNPDTWRAEVPVWEGVRLKNIYPKIDLVLTSNGGRFTPRLVARKGADVSQVKLRIQGAQELKLAKNGLQVKTAVRAFTLPLFQLVNKTGNAEKLQDPQIEGLVLNAPFAMGASSKNTEVTLDDEVVYQTMFGGDEADFGNAVAVDAAGNAYVAGSSYSSNFQATGNPSPFTDDGFVAKVDANGTVVQTTMFGGTESDSPAFGGDSFGYKDAFAAQVSSNGGLAWAQRWGGDYHDFADSIAWQGTGLVVSGASGSQNWGAPSSNFSAYLISVDPNGGVGGPEFLSMDTGTFETPWSVATGVAVDGANNVWVTGVADSYVYIENHSSGAVQLFGGTGWNWASGIAADNSGNVYAVGSTNSSDWSGYHGGTCPDIDVSRPCDDAFVIRLDASGGATTQLFGGTSDDRALDVATDAQGQIYVVGETSSSDWLSPGVSTRNGLLMQLDATLALNRVSTIGGGIATTAEGVAVDATDSIYVTGFVENGAEGDTSVYIGKFNLTGGGTATPTATWTATSTPTPTATATPNVPLVTLEVTDANGVPVTVLNTNSDGWYEQNPVNVNVTINNPSLESLHLNGFIQFGSTGDLTRFFVVEQSSIPLDCPDTKVQYDSSAFSYILEKVECSSLEIFPQETLTFSWVLWIQPSSASQFDLKVEMADGSKLYGKQATSILVPLGDLYPTAIVPGFGVFDSKITDTFYAPLRNTLLKMGYSDNSTLFSSSQNFLESHSNIAAQLASNLDGDWRNKANQVPWVKQPLKFNLIGHSQGVLIVRAYLEIVTHPFVDVNRVVLIGGPNKGVLRAYSVREGLYKSSNADDMMNYMVDLLWERAYNCGYYSTPTPQQIFPQVSDEQKYDTLHDRRCGILSPPEILPVPDSNVNDHDYLVSFENGISFPFGRLRNPLLENTPNNDVEDPWFDYPNTTYYALNSPAQLNTMIGRLGGDLSKLYVIYGARADTTEAIYKVVAREPGSRLWTNGRLVTPVVLKSGDDTITIYSGLAESLWSTAKMFHLEKSGQLDVKHTNMPVHPEMQQTIGEFLTGTMPTFASAFEASNNWIQCAQLTTCINQDSQKLNQVETPAPQWSRLTILGTGTAGFSSPSPVDLLLTDPLGRRLGYDPVNSQIVNEIPGGLYGHATGFPSELYVLNPMPGGWHLNIIGTNTGNYRVFGTISDAAAAVPLLLNEGVIQVGQTNPVSFTVPEKSTDIPSQPEVNAGGNTSRQVGEAVTFSGSFKDINPNDTHTIEWNFGDGGTATGTLTPAHAFNTPGVFTVTLTVTDSSGFSVSDTLQVTVVSPTGTPTYTPSSTQTYTPTHTPTFTSTPANTPTPTPTFTPTPAGTGLNGEVDVILKDSSGNLYVGGQFTATSDGATTLNRIAKWNSTTQVWSALGTGLNGAVYGLAFDATGNLYAGGAFTNAGGNASADYIAKWDGSTWSALGAGTNNTVYALTFNTNGNLYAGGAFINAGGDANADYIAKWNPTTQTWSAIGTGVNSWVHAIAFDTNGNLYAGGGFTSAGTCASDCKYIAKWNGSTWSGLSTGMNFAVRSLAFNAGTLYAGGVFTTAGTCSSNCSRIAKWNRTTWSGVGGGVGNQVYAVRFDTSGNLYATGWFETAGSCSSNCQHIAKWNGSAWSALGSGLKYDGMSLLLDGDVYVAGGFATTGDGLTALNYIAKWNGSEWIPFE